MSGDNGTRACLAAPSVSKSFAEHRLPHTPKASSGCEGVSTAPFTPLTQPARGPDAYTVALMEAWLRASFCANAMRRRAELFLQRLFGEAADTISSRRPPAHATSPSTFLGGAALGNDTDRAAVQMTDHHVKAESSADRCAIFVGA